MIFGLDNTPLRDRDPAVARRLVDDGGLLLDVRERHEFAQQHIEGAALIPVGQLLDRFEELLALVERDITRPIVLYCRSGARAGRAKAMLQAAGFTRVVNLGGVDDWSRAG